MIFRMCPTNQVCVINKALHWRLHRVYCMFIRILVCCRPVRWCRRQQSVILCQSARGYWCASRTDECCILYGTAATEQFGKSSSLHNGIIVTIWRMKATPAG